MVSEGDKEGGWELTRNARGCACVCVCVGEENKLRGVCGEL